MGELCGGESGGLLREQGSLTGKESPAQIKAFGDTWNWAGAAESWASFAEICPVPKVIELMRGFHNTLGENDVMAYLVMMAPRLYHLWRVLKPTGSLYLHCDPTASHYLKLILDAIFGAKNFRNEIVWKRTNAHGSAKRWGPVHDVIFYYTKGHDYIWHKVYEDYDAAYVENFYKLSDANGYYQLVSLTGAGTRTGDSGKVWRGVDPTSVGRHWAIPLKTLYGIIDSASAVGLTTQQKLDILDQSGMIYWPTKGSTPRYKRYLTETPGVSIQDVINDIQPLSAHAAERLGYPTQKPLALLERIINASSNPGDVVLDPFCGCGTAIVAAQKLGRNWLGIDVTPIATSLIQKRLFDQFEARDLRLLSAADKSNATALARAFRVEGLPTDEAGARAMFEADHKKFEMWAVGLVPAIPQEKKGADGGIDGLAYFDVGAKDLTKAVVQVKGGKNVGSPGVQQLKGAMQGFGASLGFYVTLEAPTKHMIAEALSAGFYKAATGVGRQVPAMQLRTVGELLGGHGFEFPVTVGSNVSFKQAAAIAAASGQVGLDL